MVCKDDIWQWVCSFMSNCSLDETFPFKKKIIREGNSPEFIREGKRTYKLPEWRKNSRKRRKEQTDIRTPSLVAQRKWVVLLNGVLYMVLSPRSSAKLEVELYMDKIQEVVFWSRSWQGFWPDGFYLFFPSKRLGAFCTII